MLLDTWSNIRARAEKLLTPAQRWEVAKAQALRNLEKYNPFHEPEGSPEGGRFAEGEGGGGGGGGGGSEAKPGAPPPLIGSGNPEVRALIESVPGADKKIAEIADKIGRGVETDRPVSEGGFKMRNGSYTPDRQKNHAETLEFLLKDWEKAVPKPGEQPVVHLLGGAGGSGKSWYTGPQGTVSKDNAIVLNPDDVKGKLIGYEGWNAPLYHEESSDVHKLAEKLARDMRLNVIIDGTMGKLSTLEKRITEYKKAGYRIEGHFMRVTPQTAAKRALERFVRGGPMGRYVMPELLLSHSAVPNFENQRSRMDTSEIYDNEKEGGKPYLVDKR